MTDNQPKPVAEHSEPHIYTSLTYEPLSPTTHLAHVRTPEAGALVLFAGTTRATFDDRPVANLTYQAYVPLALATLTSIAKAILSKTYPVDEGSSSSSGSGTNNNKEKVGAGGGGGGGGGENQNETKNEEGMKKNAPAKKTRGIKAIAITHRLGVVPIGEESILVAVSAAHRTEAWRAGEECLEEVKKRTEIWKLETFADERGEAVWRANDSGQPKETKPPT